MSYEEIISNVLSLNGENKSYYAEGSMKVMTGGEITEHISFQEYAGSAGERKVITTDHLNYNQQLIKVNDGKTLITFYQSSNEAFRMDLNGGKTPPASMTHTEIGTGILEGFKDMYEYEVTGKEKIHGFDSYHLKALVKKKNGILGDMDFWVDSKTWFVVKSIAPFGDNVSEMEYKKIDFSPKFPADTFVLNLPSNVEITPIEPGSETKVGTIADAEKAIGKPFLIFQGPNITVDQVEIDELKGELNRKEITIQYMKQNIPAFSVSIFTTPKEPGMEIEKGSWQVRGQNAEHDQFINGLTWDEEGLRYSLLIYNPDLRIDDVIEMAEHMRLSSEK